MSRQEFPRQVRVEAIKRATDERGVIRCEGCGGAARRLRVDHRIADSHGGKPTLENAQVLGICCWAEKDAKDTTIAAKLKRVEAAHLNVPTRPVQKLKSRPFGISTRTAEREKRGPKQSLPPRQLYRDILP